LPDPAVLPAVPSQRIQTSINVADLAATAMSSEYSMRGRTRDRSHNRSSLNNDRSDRLEASTLRGRSRQRASSPHDSSRNPSGSLLSPTRQILYNRLHYPRREHCPSRAPSPVGQRRRTRSRSRGLPRLEREAFKMADAQSGLRNELHVEEEVAPPVEQA